MQDYKVCALAHYQAAFGCCIPLFVPKLHGLDTLQLVLVVSFSYELTSTKFNVPLAPMDGGHQPLQLAPDSI